MVQLRLLHGSAWLQFPFPAGALIPLMLPAAAHGPVLTPSASSYTAGLGAPQIHCCKGTAGLREVVASPRWQQCHWDARSRLRRESC